MGVIRAEAEGREPEPITNRPGLVPRNDKIMHVIGFMESVLCRRSDDFRKKAQPVAADGNGTELGGSEAVGPLVMIRAGMPVVASRQRGSTVLASLGRAPALQVLAQLTTPRLLHGTSRVMNSTFRDGQRQRALRQ